MVNYPGSLDSLANPTDTTRRNDPGFELHEVISTLNDIAEALQLKVGIGASTPTTAGDVGHVTGAGATTWGPRALVRLGETILSSSTASITFSSIPSTYRHLLVEWLVRDATAGTTGAGMHMRFNGDTGSNYDYQQLTSAAAAASAAESLAQGSFRIGSVVNGSAAANLFASGVTHIAHYAGTAHEKSCLSTGGIKFGTSTGQIVTTYFFGGWRSTAAITSITLLAASGNLASGSMATLYGVPQ